VVEDGAFIAKARALRPFYFIVVAWGDRYTDFLLNFCIASLLSPNNIPALLNSGNKFLIATTDEDWARMQSRPIFQILKQYVEPVFIRIPRPSATSNFCMSASMGHKLATHMAYEDRAYGALLVPDQIVSDGTVASLQRHAVDGYQVVLTAWLRFGEEPLFEQLKLMGKATLDSCSGDESRPLTVTGRQLVSAGIRSFHSQTACYEWNASYFEPLAAVWWHVPEENGVIVHSLNWAPMLIDYDAVEHHDSSTMDNWTIDGDYIHRNFGLNGKVHVVQDSDEMMLVSFGPLNVGPQSLAPRSKFATPFIGKWMKELALHETLSNPIFDPLKQQIFTRPVYWHSRDINQEKWSTTENEALGIIKKINKYRFPKGALEHFMAFNVKSVIKIRDTTIRYKRAIFPYYDYSYRIYRHIVCIIRIVTRRVGLLLLGNRLALRWWWWRLRKLKSGLAGQPFPEPQPPAP